MRSSPPPESRGSDASLAATPLPADDTLPVFETRRLIIVGLLLAGFGAAGVTQRPIFALAEPGIALKPWTGPAPIFTLERLDGETESLASRKGRVSVIHFFATWCEPCRKEVVSLQRLFERLPKDGFAVVGVDVGEVDIRVRRFFETLPVGFSIALDRDGAVARSWGVDALPATFVLDRNLTPKFYVQGDLDWDRPEIDRLLAELSIGKARGAEIQQNAIAEDRGG